MAGLRHLGLARDPFAVDGEPPATGELSPAQAREWVLARLAEAGGDAALMAPGALGALAYAADGSGERLQRLAAGAMRLAADDGARRIEMAHARRAIAAERGKPDAVIAPAELQPVRRDPAPDRRSGRARLLALAAVSAAAGAAAILWLQPTATPSRDIAPSPAPVESPEPPTDVPAPQVAAAAVAPTPQAPPTPSPGPPPTVARAETRPAPPAAEPPAEPARAAPSAPRPAAQEPPPLVLRYGAAQPGAADAAARVAALLRARGHEVAVRPAAGRIGQASTRYPAGARDAAEAVNRAYETVLRAYQPDAASLAIAGAASGGPIELWLPDSAAGASRPLRTDAPPV